MQDQFSKIGNVKVIQIAGLIARRIECFVKKNQVVKKGQRIAPAKIGRARTLS